MLDSQTGRSVAEVRATAANEWDLKRPHRDIAIVTGNTGNMDAASLLISSLLPSLQTLRLRRLGSDCCESLTGSGEACCCFPPSGRQGAVFPAKRKALGLAGNKLIVDVPT